MQRRSLSPSVTPVITLLTGPVNSVMTHRKQKN